MARPTYVLRIRGVSNCQIRPYATQASGASFPCLIYLGHGNGGLTLGTPASRYDVGTAEIQPKARNPLFSILLEIKGIFCYSFIK